MFVHHSNFGMWCIYFWFVKEQEWVEKNNLTNSFLCTLFHFGRVRGFTLFLCKCFAVVYRNIYKKKHFDQEWAPETGISFFQYYITKRIITHDKFCDGVFLWTLEDCKHIHLHNFKLVCDTKFFNLSQHGHPHFLTTGLIQGKTSDGKY